MPRSLLWLATLGLAIASPYAAAQTPSQAPYRDVAVVAQLPNASATEIGDATPINAVAISPDGRRILTGDQQGNVKLWDLASGAFIRGFRHAPAVSAVAFSPDGRRIASGSATAKIWDGETGRLIHSLEQDAAPGINAFSFSSNGLRLASGNNDGSVRMWDVLSGRSVAAISATSDSVTAIALSADGTRVLTGGQNSEIRLTDTNTRDLIRSFAGHTSPIRSLAFSADGSTILSGAADSARAWDAVTGKPIQSTALPPWTVTMAVSPDRARVLACCNDQTVLVSDAETRAALNTVQVTEHGITALSFTPDGRRAVLANDRGELAILDDVISGQDLRIVNRNTPDALHAVTVSPDGRRLLVGGDRGKLLLWDLEGARLVHGMQGKAERINAVATSRDNRRLLSGDRFGDRFDLWDAQDGRLVRSFEKDLSIHLAATFSPDGRLVLAATFDDGRPVTGLWDAESGALVHRLDADGSERAAFSPDGRHLVITGNGAPTLWDVATGKLLRTFDIAGSLSVTFAPDSRRVLLGSEGKPATLFDVESGKAVPGLQFPYSDSFTFSRDGRRLLSHSTEDVRLFDLTSGRLLGGIEGYPPYETQAVFGLDSQTWIAGGYGRTLTVRDVETSGILRQFGAHSGPITALAPFPAGARIVSASADGTARLWNAASGELLATFVSAENGEWLIVTPEGFFSASADGGGLVKLVRGMEVYPVDRARDQLQRPDLVAEKIAGDPRGLVRDALSRLDLAKAIADPR